jgi:hypothetical protein
LGGFSGEYNVITERTTDFGGNHLMVQEGTTPNITFTANPARLWHGGGASVSDINLIHSPGVTAQSMAVNFFSNISFTAVN